MSKAGELEYRYLQDNGKQLFTGRNHLLGILRHKIQVSELGSVPPREDETLSCLSFGQFIAFHANELGYSINELAEKVSASVDYIEEIYDDAILPWEMSVDFVLRFSHVLNLPKAALIKVIENHQIDPMELRKRIAPSAMAARTHHTLDRRTRENELLEAQLRVQALREERNRRDFLESLREYSG